MPKEKTLWNDAFRIVFTLQTNEQIVEQFKGSLRSAIRYSLHRYPRATANFYNSDDCWLKEVGW